MGGITYGFVTASVGGLDGRLVIGLVGGLGGALVGGLAGGHRFGRIIEPVLGLGGGLVVGLGSSLGGALGGALVGGLVGGLVSETESEPRTIFPRWPRPRELSTLLVIGLVLGLARGLTVGLVGGLWAAFLMALVALLALWAAPLPGAATPTPTASYRSDRRTSLGLGLGSGLTLGLGGGLWVGLVGGFALGFMFVFSSGWMKVNLIELLLSTTGAGKVKFIQVLEDAHHRHVLRQAGAVYQFRHAELQDHLAEIHRSQSQPPTNT